MRESEEKFLNVKCRLNQGKAMSHVGEVNRCYLERWARETELVCMILETVREKNKSTQTA